MEKEYFSQILGRYLEKNGIVYQTSCIDTPQQNRITKRKNRHLLEVAREMMFQMRIPKHFLGETMLTASYLIIRMSTCVLKFDTPINTLKNVYPTSHQFFTLISLKVFGNLAFIHIHDHNTSKLDGRVIKCVFLGYSPTQKGYKCFHPLSKIFCLHKMCFCLTLPSSLFHAM